MGQNLGIVRNNPIQNTDFSNQSRKSTDLSKQKNIFKSRTYIQEIQQSFWIYNYDLQNTKDYFLVQLQQPHYKMIFVIKVMLKLSGVCSIIIIQSRVLMGCRMSLLKLVILSFLLQFLSSFECNPFFSQKYCQMLQEMNASNDKNVQCHKNDEKCPIQVYENYSYTQNNYLIIGIRAKENFTIHSAAKTRSYFTLIDATKIILEEIYMLFKEIFYDLVQEIKFVEKDSTSIQYSDNFASIHGGAMILRLSSNKIKAAGSILDYNNDQYLYTDQTLPFEIVIALKEEVSIQRIVIRSKQIYSSIMNEFIVYGAIALTNQENEEDNWSKLVQAKAKNEATQQQYRTIKKVIRYLKIKIISVHGDWKYFTMTQIKVYGSSVYAEAMTSYQSNIDYQIQPEIDTTSIHLYQDLKKMILLAKEGNKTIPQNNLITYFFQQLQKLTKIEQQQIYYLNNLTLKIQDLQNKTYPVEAKSDSKQQERNLTEQKDFLYFKQIYERQCYSPISQEQILNTIDSSYNLTSNKTSKRKPQSIFKVFYQIQKYAQQKQQMKKNLQILSKQMKEVQHNQANLSQNIFILVNILCSIVISAVLATFILLNYRSKNKRNLQIQHKNIQIHHL